MVRGMYTAASGMLTVVRDINVKSNNMANLNTAGFKQDRLVTTTFAEAVAVRQEIRTTGPKHEIGGSVRGKTALEIKTDFAQGSLQETNRNLDFAISGGGFFTVQSQSADAFGDEKYYEGKYYTRNGHFQIDPDGYLIDGLGNYVLDIYDDPIAVERYDFVSDEFGNLFTAEGEYISTLGIFNPRNPDFLIKAEEYPFVILNEDIAMAENEDGELHLENLEFTGFIRQGYIERANTDIASQMAGLISASRSFQSMSQVVRAIDGLISRSVTEVGRV
jgi:flagellar basal-body rod protein FlgG